MNRTRYVLPLEFEWLSAPQHIFGGPKMRALLEFDADDPYSVTLKLYPPAHPSMTGATDAANAVVILVGDEIPWVFSREILHHALRKPAGTMWVHAWPDVVAGHEYVYIKLANPEGETTFRIGRWVIFHFIKEIESMVPLLDASNWLDLDGELVELLTNEEEQ